MKKVVCTRLIETCPVAEDLEVIESQTPACSGNGVIVQVMYLSLEPYIGSVLRGRHVSSTRPEPGKDALPGSVVGKVIESKSSNFKVGDWVFALSGRWEEISFFKDDELLRVDTSIAHLSAFTGLLGIPGLTAWASATQLAKVGEDDTVLVNAAAGAVGGTFGQLARLKGAKQVIGVAGGPTKCQIVKEEYGFDDCVDYKSLEWREVLKDLVPEGISVFHENVSAEMAMHSLSLAKPYARGVLCGLAAAYQADTQQTHPINAGLVIMKRAQLLGLVVYDFIPRWQEFISEMGDWVRSEQLVIREDRVVGLENAPKLFEKLMRGENIGKTIVAMEN